MAKELIVIESKKFLTAYTDDGIDPYIKQAKELVANFDYDLSTVTSRAKIASLSSKVSKFKVKLDGVGKDLVAEWKVKTGLVDKSRKKMREELDELRDLARKPLTDWEDEQKEIERLNAEKLLAEQKQAQVDQDHELAIEQYKTHLREVSDKKISDALAEKLLLEQQEKDRIARDEEIKQQAAADAKKEVEAERLKAIDDKLKAELAATEAKVKAELLVEQAAKLKLEQDWFNYISEAYTINDDLNAKAELKRLADIAEQNRIQAIEDAKTASINAENARLQAIENERLAGMQRQKDKEAQIKIESDKRADNDKYLRSVHGSILKVLIANGISEKDGKTMITLAAKKKLPKLTINY